MTRHRGPCRIAWVGIGLALALVAMGGTARTSQGLSWFGRRPTPGYMTTPVRKADLTVKVTTGGTVESTDKTMIECELEAAVGESWASATILSLADEGSMVKQGDVICSLDATRHEEKLRVARIFVGQARADLRGAELTLEVARIAVVEYRDGLMRQTEKALEGAVALAKSDHERTLDRLQWSRRMLEKGYLSKGQVTTEEAAVARLAHELKKAETALTTFKAWDAPKQLKALDSEVLKAEANHEYQSSRLEQYEDRLGYFEKQVEKCTIRAPHDGFLVYNDYGVPELRPKEGGVTWKSQKLFYLPDLNRLEVRAILHESVVKDVKPGMKAKVGVESFPGLAIEGRVASIALLPSVEWFSDVRHFAAVIKLDEVPRGLKPGMTANVELSAATNPEVLVVPSEALTVEEGKEVCYIAGPGGLLRREVTTGQVTRDLIEVVGGLGEGDQVVLDPTRLSAEVLRGAEAGRDARPQPGP